MRRFLSGLLGAAALSAAPLFAQEDGDLFTKLDANKDGFVTADEVSEDNKSKFERQLRTSDKDGDKKLSKDEFSASLKPDDAPRQPLAGGAGPGRPGGRPDPKAMFAEMDKDKDGKLSKDEVRGPFQQNFDRVDANSDGSVSEEEFLEVARRFAGGGQPPMSPEQIEQMFNRLDANSDDKLTKDEFPEDRQEQIGRILERLGSDSLNKEQFARVAGFLAPRGPRPGEGRPGEGRPGEGRPGEGRPGEGRPPMGPGPFLRVLDADADGEISADEIEAAPKALLSLDRNKDGKLTLDEVGPPPPPREGGRPGEGRPGEGRPGAGRPGGDFNPIANFDKDGDGKLSKEEAPERMKENFDRLDANSDGFVDGPELRQAFSRREGGDRPNGDRREGDRREGDRRPEGDRPRNERPAEPKAD